MPTRRPNATMNQQEPTFNRGQGQAKGRTRAKIPTQVKSYTQIKVHTQAQVHTQARANAENQFVSLRSVALIFVFFFGLIGLPPQSVDAQQAKSVYRFLLLDSHARTAALGGAHPAIPDADYSLFHVNPAFLASPYSALASTPSSRSNAKTLTNSTNKRSSSSAARSFHASYINHLDDVQYLSASTQLQKGDLANLLPFGIPSLRLPPLALSVRAMHYGDLTGYDETGAETGSLSAGELAVSAGMGDWLHEQIAWGISATWIHSGLAGYRSGGVAVSAGLHGISADGKTSIGLTILNAGAQITPYDQTREPIPLQVHAGVSQRLEYLPLRYFVTARLRPSDDLRTAGEESLSLADRIARSMVIGGEIYFGETVTLRLGYDYLQGQHTGTGKRIDTAGLHGGLGIHLKRFDLHVARTSLSDMGGVLQLSIFYRL